MIKIPYKFTMSLLLFIGTAHAQPPINKGCQKWNPVSNTALSITGPIYFCDKTIIINNKNISITNIGSLSISLPFQKVNNYISYRVNGDYDLGYHNKNKVCSKNPNYIYIYQDKEVISLIISSGEKYSDTSEDNYCGVFGYMK